MIKKSQLVCLFALIISQNVQCFDLILSGESFDEIVGGEYNCFVDFFAPWCDHCQKLEPIWKELMKTYNKEPKKYKTLIARVDCTQEVDLCNREGIKEYPTLRIYHKSKTNGVDYEGARDLKSLQQFVSKLFDLPKEDSFADSILDALNVKSLESETDFESDLTHDLDLDELPENKLGLYMLNDENYEAFLAKGRHFVKFFAPWCGHCTRLAPVWQELAQSFQYDRSVSISELDCEAYPDVCRQYSVKGYPTLLWIIDGTVMEKYTGARTYDELRKFALEKKQEEQMKNKLNENVRFEDIITQLTGTNFHTFIKEDLSFIFFDTPWCTRCRKVKPAFNELSKKLLGKLRLGSVDCEAFETLCLRYDIDSYPTLLLFRNGQKVREFEDEINLENLYNFADKYLTMKDEL